MMYSYLFLHFRISKIKTQKPYGMKSTRTVEDPDVPGRKMVTLTWVPTYYDLGEHTLCYSALDSERYVESAINLSVGCVGVGVWGVCV